MTAEAHIAAAKDNRNRIDENQSRRRARATAVVLAMSTVISLVFLIFAFGERARAEHLQERLDQTVRALEACESGH